MPGAVVITRPLAQARPLAARVAALGLTVELLPLLEIAALDDQAPLRAALSQLASYAMVAFVSPNAIDAAFSQLGQMGLAWPAGVRLAVLGEGSRAALAAHGMTPAYFDIVSPADTANSDTEHLLQTLDLAALNGRRVLIVRGESGRELMADGLRAAGAEVSVVAAYRRTVPVLTPALHATLARLLAQQNDWLITSSEALRGVLALAAQMDLAGRSPDPALLRPTAEAGAIASDHNACVSPTYFVVAMQQQHLIVPHARIAETANKLGFSRLTLTGSGDERLLAALQLRL